MPQTELKFRILLSSPGELADERVAISEVVVELNKSWGRSHGATIEILSWENTVAPGFGVEPQAVVNDALGEEWDIYLGLMFTKFGTPTREFGSGTKEEFERAYGLWEKNKETRRIMFYFRNGAIDIKAIDLNQLAEVREFQKSFRLRGGLYGEYENIDKLKGFLRVHLVSVLEELKIQFEQATPATQKTISMKSALTSTAGEPGLLDYQFAMEQAGSSIKDVFDEHNSILNELTALMAARQTSIKEAVEKNDYAKLRHLTSVISIGMRNAAERFAAVRGKYSADSRKFFENMTRLLSVDLGNAPVTEKEKLIHVLEGGLTTMEVLISGSKSAGESMDKWGNISRDFTASKAQLRTELNAFNSVTEKNMEEVKQLLSILNTEPRV